MTTTRWCPQCREEFVEGVEECPDCAAPLVAELPPVDEAGQVLVYDLADWTSDQRGALELRLKAEGIEHTWETGEGREVLYGYESKAAWEVATDLVVGEDDEEMVDVALDEVEFPDALEGVEDDGGDDEAVYSVMADLYVAADRLKDDPGDLSVAGELFDAADRARAIGPPFGVDPDVWAQVQALASAVTASLEAEEDDEVVAARASALRDLLFSYV